MMWTSHGHHIPGTVLKDDYDERPSVHRCGGPSSCKTCAAEAIRVLNSELDPRLEDLIPLHKPKIEDIVDTEIKTVELVRKPFFVTAVQVTAENMDAVAKWCGGDVRISNRNRAKKEVKVVHVEVLRATADWHKEARVTDWVVKAGSGYKVYTNKALVDTFDPRPLDDGYIAIPREAFEAALNCD